MKHTSRKNIELILHGSLVRAMLAIAIPVVINSFLQTMYNLTDTYWLGQLGTSELAAINLITPVQNIVISFGGGVTTAGAVMIAQYIGAGRQDSAKRIANHIFAVAMAFSLLCASLLAILTPGIVSWLGAEGTTRQNAVTYLRLVILDMPFLFMVNIYQAVRQAQGDTVRPMLLNLLGIAVNMVFDPLLMVVIPLGAAGAARATALAKALPAGLAFSFLLRCWEEAVYLDVHEMRPTRQSLLDILRIGLPTAIGGSVMHLGFLLMSRNVNAYGMQAMAAYGIGNRVNSLITLPSNGVGSAVSTIVGQNMGAKQPDRACKGYLLSMGCMAVFLFLSGRVMCMPAVASAVVGIFSDDAQVIAMAADFLTVMAFWCFTNAIHDATCGLFQGSGHTEVPMAVNMTRLWVLRLGSLWLCETVLDMGVRSIWYSVVISNGISAAALLLLYTTGLWKKSRIKT